MSTSKWRGNDIYKDFIGNWKYRSDNEFVCSDPNRKCGSCGLDQTIEGHDGCLGTLPYVMNACCGHGDKKDTYVQFTQGTIIQGLLALNIIKTFKSLEKIKWLKKIMMYKYLLDK